MLRETRLKKRKQRIRMERLNNAEWTVLFSCLKIHQKQDVIISISKPAGRGVWFNTPGLDYTKPCRFRLLDILTSIRSDQRTHRPHLISNFWAGNAKARIW